MRSLGWFILLAGSLPAAMAADPVVLSGSLLALPGAVFLKERIHWDRPGPLE